MDALLQNFANCLPFGKKIYSLGHKSWAFKEMTISLMCPYFGGKMSIPSIAPSNTYVWSMLNQSC